MLDLALRPLKDRILEPVAARLAGSLPAAALTGIGLALGLLAAGLSAAGQRWLPLMLWLAGRIFDGLDGLVARRQATDSDLGGYLDMLADTIAYTAIPIGVAMGGGATTARWAATAVLLGSFYLNTMSWAYLSALLEKRGRGAARSNERTSITMPSGLIEGSETIVCYSLFLAWPARSVPLFWIMAGLVAVNVIQRVVWASRNLRTA